MCLRLLLALIVACVSTASYAVPPVTVMSLACTGSTFVGITTHAMIWSSAYAEASDSTGLVTSLLHMVSAKAGWTADVLATVLQIASLVVQDLALSLFCVVAVNIALYLWTRS